MIKHIKCNGCNHEYDVEEVLACPKCQLPVIQFGVVDLRMNSTLETNSTPTNYWKNKYEALLKEQKVQYTHSTLWLKDDDKMPSEDEYYKQLYMMLKDSENPDNITEIKEL